ncbi:MAG: RNA polymerase sigma factor [Herpetosiphonaceae bacterium]|nr:RNA polymerase sigma factor [Herpetosiphonaceae bacterium]
MEAVQSGAALAPFEAMLASERSRLVRLCGYIVNNADVAEDLAQETLLEAWRYRHRLSDPQGTSAWLSAIARNVCLRWLRRNGRDQTRLVLPSTTAGNTVADVVDSLPDPFDIEVELERDELALLLDRALGLLPPETRTVLVQKYVEELPHAVIAARLGLSENAVAVRVHRGKLAIRHVLATELHADAAVYGLTAEGSNEWQATRLWCPLCGQSYLRGRLATLMQPFALQCPHCQGAPGGLFIEAGLNQLQLFSGVKGFKASYSRLCSWMRAYQSRTLHAATVLCAQCGGEVVVSRRLGPTVPLQHRGIRGVYARCAHCGTTSYASLNGLILNVPAVQPFWRHYPRMRVLPEQEIEVAGRPTLLKRCESLDGHAWLDILVDPDTLDVLRVDGASDA